MLIVYHPICPVRFSSIYIYNINALHKGLKVEISNGLTWENTCFKD